MNVVIVCQSCRKPLTIPAEGLGKKVKCPACQTVFVGQRDEFKPRSASNGEAATTTAPIPPTNDAILSAEDAAPGLASDDFAGVGADASTPTLTAPAKKKSYVWLILLIVGLVVGLPVLVLSGLFVFGVLGAVFFLEQKAPSVAPPQNIQMNDSPVEMKRVGDKQLPPAPEEAPLVAPGKDAPK